MAKPSYQHLENPLLRGARYDLFNVFLCIYTMLALQLPKDIVYDIIVYDM